MALKTAFITSVGVGICVCHMIPIPMVGVVITASTDKKVENNGAARVTDIVIGKCGHIGVLISGSSMVKSSGLDQTTVTSPFTGCFSGVIVSGASSHSTG